MTERIDYVLRRSRRAKRLRAEIGPGTGLVVVLPEGQPESSIAPFLERHRRWVRNGLRRAARLAEWPRPSLEPGSVLSVLGTDLALELGVGAESVLRRGDTLDVRVPRRTRAAVRRAIRAWLMTEAARELGARAAETARRHGLSFRRLRIGDAKRRWGSCSARGDLAFTWRVLLLPEAVAQYLVCHELAHLRVPGHPPAFYAEVERLCPEWREAERWLRRLGAAVDLG
jgi:predicted metal-dependent hydrolase